MVTILCEDDLKEANMSGVSGDSGLLQERYDWFMQGTSQMCLELCSPAVLFVRVLFDAEQEVYKLKQSKVLFISSQDTMYK